MTNTPKKSLRTPGQKMLQTLLRRARKEAGLTQIQLAERLGWKQANISKIESGERRVDVIEFIRIARILGLSVAQTISSIEKSVDI